MKTHFHLRSEPEANGHSPHPAAVPRAFARLGICLIVCLAAAGCGKSGKSTAPKPEAAASASAATAPVDGEIASPPSPRGPVALNSTLPKPAVITDTASVDATLNQLSSELRNYVVRTRSVPKNFEEFAAKSQVQAPPAPAGKKYAIQNRAVVLVSR
jgi:hypothetical protein